MGSWCEVARSREQVTVNLKKRLHVAGLHVELARLSLVAIFTPLTMTLGGRGTLCLVRECINDGDHLTRVQSHLLCPVLSPTSATRLSFYKPEISLRNVSERFQ